MEDAQFINLRIRKLKLPIDTERRNTMSAKSFRDYIEKEGRIDWVFYCLSKRNLSSCADIGSGWGALTFYLARWYDQVYSLEKNDKRIKFQVRKNKDKKCDSVYFVKADMRHLPFNQKQFDLVCLNGVFEWTGSSNSHQNIKKLQLKLLKDIYAVLREEGCLYIGIENRFGFQYIMGARNHGELPFTSLLPGVIASLLMRILEGRKHVIYIYSLPEYKKFLRKAGFSHIEFYWVFPSYRYPFYSGEIRNPKSFKFYLEIIRKKAKRKKLIEMLSILPDWLIRILLYWFSPHFLIFAWKKRPKLIFEHVEKQNFLQISGKHHIYRIIFGKNWEIISKIKLRRFPSNIEKRRLQID